MLRRPYWIGDRGAVSRLQFGKYREASELLDEINGSIQVGDDTG